jgi:predicted enzyme related to lactoylglutathione lyase
VVEKGKRYRFVFKTTAATCIPSTTLNREEQMAKVSVRYIVSDVDAAIPFYRDMLGFAVDMHPAPGFAALSRGDLVLLLNRPGAGGAGQTRSDGQIPAPGGWNRIQIEVSDLTATVAKLKAAGCKFRGEIVIGNGGNQALVDDPSGNCVELFEPAPGLARTAART